jgi:hypothetical protein
MTDMETLLTFPLILSQFIQSTLSTSNKGLNIMKNQLTDHIIYALGFVALIIVWLTA